MSINDGESVHREHFINDDTWTNHRNSDNHEAIRFLEGNGVVLKNSPKLLDAMVWFYKVSYGLTYSDHAIDLNMVKNMSTFYDIPAFLSYLSMNFYIDSDIRYDPSARDARIWKVIVFNDRNFSIPNVDMVTTTISHFARVPGTQIRQTLSEMDKDGLYEVRRYIGLRWLRSHGIPGGVITTGFHLRGQRIGGRAHLYYVQNGETQYASISGHMIAQILWCSMYGSLDFRRFFKVLLNDAPPKVHKYKNHVIRGARGKVEIGNVLAEEQVVSGKVGFWHNYIEYKIAVECGVWLCHVLGLYVPVGAIDIIDTFLEENREQLDIESEISRIIKSELKGRSGLLHIR